MKFRRHFLCGISDDPPIHQVRMNEGAQVLDVQYMAGASYLLTAGDEQAPIVTRHFIVVQNSTLLPEGAVYVGAYVGHGLVVNAVFEVKGPE